MEVGQCLEILRGRNGSRTRRSVSRVPITPPGWHDRSGATPTGRPGTGSCLYGVMDARTIGSLEVSVVGLGTNNFGFFMEADAVRRW